MNFSWPYLAPTQEKRKAASIGQLTLADIGWWRSELMIHTRVSSPRINVVRGPSQLSIGDKILRTSTRAGSFELVDPLPGNEELNLTHVRISQSSF